jgi:hypothetical protein
MKFRVSKTDRRHTANHVFKYYAEPELGIGRDNRIERFKELREWCWEMFGPACERDFVVLRPVPNFTTGETKMQSVERWAWYSEFNNLRIYLRGDEEMTFFTLKWQ